MTADPKERDTGAPASRSFVRSGQLLRPGWPGMALQTGIADAQAAEVLFPLKEAQTVIFVAGLTVGTDKYVVFPHADGADIGDSFSRWDRQGAAAAARAGESAGPFL